jgi:hypothetical protein
MCHALPSRDSNVFERPLLLINWQSRIWLRCIDKRETSVTLRNPSFCQATFSAPSDLLGYSLGSILRVPLGLLVAGMINLLLHVWGFIVVFEAGCSFLLHNIRSKRQLDNYELQPCLLQIINYSFFRRDRKKWKKVTASSCLSACKDFELSGRFFVKKYGGELYWNMFIKFCLG